MQRLAAHNFSSKLASLDVEESPNGNRRADGTNGHPKEHHDGFAPEQLPIGQEHLMEQSIG